MPSAFHHGLRTTHFASSPSIARFSLFLCLLLSFFVYPYSIGCIPGTGIRVCLQSLTRMVR